MGATNATQPPDRSLRQRLYDQLEAAPGASLSPLNKVLVSVIVASVALGVVGTEPLVQEALGQALPWLELALGLVFFAEFLVRLWCAGINPRYAGPAGTLRYLRRPLSIVDILVIASLIAPAFGAEFVVLRLLRLLRLVALAKFGRYSRALRLLGEAFYLRRYELKLSVIIASLVLLISATCMYAIEGDIQPEAFGSIPRALWWSVATLTTVGYGDVYPLTPLGRLFAGITAIAGVGLIAMPTGILASAFSELSRPKG